MLRKVQKCMLPLRLSRWASSFVDSLVKDNDIRTHVCAQFEEASLHLQTIQPGKFSEDWLEPFKTCNTSVKFNIPIIKDDGKFAVIEAYRAHHQYYKLPCYGGVRIAPEVEEKKMQALAVFGTIKSVCHDIPFGGAKGGIKIDPTLFTENELKTICRRYVLELTRKQLIGSATDVIGPGMGSSEREIGWMLGAYMQLRGHMDVNYASSILGKHATHGGIDGFNEATGLGVSTGLKYFLNNNEFCNFFGIPIGTKGKRVILQGYGRVGSWTHKYLELIGCKVVGVIERNSGVYCDTGLEHRKLSEYWKAEKTFKGIKDYDTLDQEQAKELIKRECDILVLAAIEHTINKTNVKEIKAKMIAEAADAPVSYPAQKYLEERNIPILPDVLINAGNLMASYIEWLKGRDHGQSDTLDRSIETHNMVDLLRESGRDTHVCALNTGPSERAAVQIAIEEMMVQGCRAAFKYTLKHKVRMRVAAYAIAIQKLLQTYHETGSIY